MDFSRQNFVTLYLSQYWRLTYTTLYILTQLNETNVLVLDKSGLDEINFAEHWA